MSTSMNDNRRLSLAAAALFAFLILIAASAASAEWPFVYGPKVMVKTTDAETNQLFSENFQVNPRPGATYRLALRNGDPQHENPVDSATVYLNGHEVVTASDFTSMRFDFEVDVNLNDGENNIAITVAGAQGSILTAAILGRELEQGFVWGGVATMPWIGVNGGAGVDIDALVQLKANSVAGPTAVVVSFWDKEGNRVFRTRPFLMKNHSSLGLNVEEMIQNMGEDYDGSLDYILAGGWGEFSVEVHWISVAPSRITGSGTWIRFGENGVGLHLPLELVGWGRIECEQCTAEDPDGRLSGLSSTTIIDMSRQASERALR
ncbi:MAG: hypothetical protein HYV63_10455 [Candidatus Schekmanbacteria bacterium]|nr:hypothetical protein [Candidatus Schekmanbacteria bacterium]